MVPMTNASSQPLPPVDSRTNAVKSRIHQRHPRVVHRNGAASIAKFLRSPFVTRSLILVFAYSLVITQTGCQFFRKFGSSPERIPVVFNELPTQNQLLAHLKSRSAGVHQLSSNVTVSMSGTPKIRGTLQVEFPDRLRMKVGVMGASEMGVDVGSNPENFWIWMRAPGTPQAFYFANHTAFESSPLRRSIPIDPKWLIDGLGLIRFEPSDVHYGPMAAEGGRIKFFTVRQTSTGPQTHQLLIAAKTGVIEQHALYDAANRLIAYTNSSKYAVFKQNERPVSLPQRLILHMIQSDSQESEMVIDLGSISLEPLYGNPDRMWSMPVPGPSIPRIDLSQAVTGGPQQRAPASPSGQRRPPSRNAGYQRK